jgi:opacity protein-like surface antigen
MRRGLKTLVIAATVGLLWSPVPANADGFVSPWVGTNFSNEPGDGRASFGISAGGMGAGIIGGEVDFGYSPNFFGDSQGFGGSNLMNLMGNLIVGIPVGGQTGPGIRPYVTGGVGLLRSEIDGPFDDDGVSNSDFAFNLGGGVMGYFNDHVGLRGDLRYMRTVNSDLGDSDLDPEFGLGDFDFWRLSFGVVFR